MPRSRSIVAERHCKQCNKSLVRKQYPSAIEDIARFKKRKFCDRKCMGEGYEGKIKVLNERNSRKQSAKKNTGVCNRCSRVIADTRLYVHHRDENPLNNEPDNLETLCGKCHQTHHQGKDPVPCKHCSNHARHIGLCNTHYTRFRTNGDPLIRRVRIGGKWVQVRDG